MIFDKGQHTGSDTGKNCFPAFQILPFKGTWHYLVFSLFESVIS